MGSGGAAVETAAETAAVAAGGGGRDRGLGGEVTRPRAAVHRMHALVVRLIQSTLVVCLNPAPWSRLGTYEL